MTKTEAKQMINLADSGLYLSPKSDRVHNSLVKQGLVMRETVKGGYLYSLTDEGKKAMSLA